MKRSTVVFLMVAMLFAVLGARVAAQEKSTVTVQGNQLNNGVVIMDVVLNGKAYRLSCNQAMPQCTKLKGGEYQMVQLPKNYGMYECQDVDIYAETAANQDENNKLGDYCLDAK